MELRSPAANPKTVDHGAHSAEYFWERSRPGSDHSQAPEEGVDPAASDLRRTLSTPPRIAPGLPMRSDPATALREPSWAVASPDPKQLDIALDALEVTRAGERPLKSRAIADGISHRIRDQHGARPRHPGDPACHVHRTTEPVAGPADRHPAGDSGSQPGKVVVGVDDLDQLQDGIQQRRRIGADEHHRVADRLDEPHRRRGQVTRQAAPTGRQVAPALRPIPPHPAG